MLSVKKILAGRGAVDYYLNQTRRGLADYYLGEAASADGGAAAAERLAAPGSSWWGGGAEALGLHGPLERAQFVPLYSNGVRPDGRYLGRRFRTQEDAAEARALASENGGRPEESELTVSKVDAVYKSGNATRDDIPSHLVVGEEIPPEVAEFYEHICPAGVYERDGDRLIVNAPNCIDCKATDVLGPRWTPREGGSGPGYRRM